MTLLPRTRTARWAVSIALVTTMAVLTPALAAAQQPDDPPPVPGTVGSSPAARALAAADPSGLQLAVNERGRISRSISAVASRDGAATITVDKPDRATVRRAFLATATVGITRSPLSAPLEINGRPVAFGEPTPSGIQSFNYFSEVTELVRATLDAAPGGAVPLPVREPEPGLTDGTILVVIFDDPAVTVDQTVSVLFGALQPTGDRYGIRLARPVSLRDPATRLEMSLGISYSYQENGTQQFSTVDVNGRRLTSAAGGEDDGYSANGGLITVGGSGDSPTNPADPAAGPDTARSDDELYDLRPFVADGDTEITVETTNPSNDDNFFLATFTMNPPVTGIATGGDEQFVQVALGDSYQSGEGAGFDVRPSAAYLSGPYQQGTYSERIDNGDGCHRALQNYAQINRDRYEPGAEIVVVDRTCSGAEIEPGDKDPIVGPGGSRIDGNSQLAAALRELADRGLEPADVDLVTVGMGGNDAGFATTVRNCILMSIASEAGRRLRGDVLGWLVDQVGCDRLDRAPDPIGIDQAAVRRLSELEEAAQRSILGVFGAAQVLQLNYPDIVPSRNAPAYCGGLRRGDIEYTRTRLKRINAAIETAVERVADPRLTLVDTTSTFGANALCSGGADRRLANGVTRENFDAEVTRLLSLDPAFRAALGRAVAATRDAAVCFANQLNLINPCRTYDAKLATAKQRFLDAAERVLRAFDIVKGNLASRPGRTDDSLNVAADRAQGLFHPNAAGFAVLACDALAVYEDRSTAGCTSAQSPRLSTVNGRPAGRSPVAVVARQVVNLVLSGFAPNSPVRLRLFSEPVDVGAATTDSAGVLRTTVTVPEVPGGVHTLEADGEGADGVQVTGEVLLAVAGRPSGEYGAYLCCFTPEPAEIAPDAPTERVVVTVGGIELGDYLPDEFGGVLVHVPSTTRLTDPSALVIEGRSTTTGRVVRQEVSPIPSAPSLWATSGGVTIVGSGFRATGLVHAEGALDVTGSRVALTGGTEYGTTITVRGTQADILPSARRVTPGQGTPAGPGIEAYRPGGPISAAGGYRAVPPSACRGGTWTPAAAEVLTGVVYVPCGIQLNGSRTITATLAAEGPIRLTGSATSVTSPTAGTPALVTGSAAAEAVVVQGANTRIVGGVRAVGGGVRVIGSGSVLECGVVAGTIRIDGATVSSPMSPRCLPA